MDISVLVIAMVCAAVVMIVAAVALVILVLQPANKQDPLKPASARNARKTWKSWIPVIAVTLLLLMWSFWIALLFLSVSWLLRLHPRSGSTYELDDGQKRTAKRVYAWLFWSAFITVPVFAVLTIGLGFQYSSPSTNQRVFTALLPLVFHLVLLLGLTSKSAFVFRHTQQGILLISIRAGLAALSLSIGTDLGEGLWLFLLGNGALWLFGSLWGNGQVKRNECSWMKRNGETVTVAQSGLPRLAAAAHLQKSREFIQQYKKNEAFQHALAAFRSGDHEVRLQAVEVLGTLDEVEMF